MSFELCIGKGSAGDASVFGVLGFASGRGARAADASMFVAVATGRGAIAANARVFGASGFATGRGAIAADAGV